MNIEIERKFLVDASCWHAPDEGIRMQQAYLAQEGCTLRVRITPTTAYLTIKGPTRGISRAEFEYEIPREDAEAMLPLAVSAVVDKTRYIVWVEGKRWEVDVFAGANAGLIVAEIELQNENETFTRPVWLGQEVSGDRRYRNAALARCPYTQWK